MLTSLLLQSVVPDLPSRKELAGPLLNKAAEEAVADGMRVITTAVSSGGAHLGMTLDGYETTGKQHFTGVMLHVEGSTVPFDTLPSGDVHHGIQIARETEDAILAVEEKYGLKVSSLCTDDAGQFILSYSLLLLTTTRC